MITFRHRVSGAECRECYLNLKDEAGTGYGGRLPAHGTPLVVFDQAGRQFHTKKHLGSQLWRGKGGGLGLWFRLNGVQPGAIILIEYSPSERADDRQHVIHLHVVEGAKVSVAEGAPVSEHEPVSAQDVPIDVLGLSTRPYNALRRIGVDTIAQLARMSAEEIHGVYGIGARSYAEIEEKLSTYLEYDQRLRQVPAPPKPEGATPRSDPPAPQEDQALLNDTPPGRGSGEAEEEQTPDTMQPEAITKGPPVTIADWERHLRPRLQQVELVGEIPITARDCDRLGQAIRLRVQTLGHGRAMKELQFDYPCALAVYLVAQGVYGYRGGDYWTEVVQTTGLKRARAWQIGQAFEGILENLQLPLFPDMRAQAHRYVSLILAHGGIPDYCLADFFGRMLQPAVTQAYYAGMSTEELIDEWLWHASSRYFVDKPVLRFLRFGGEVAVDFVERCREMAVEYVDAGVVSEAQEIGLPERVVASYQQWIVEQSAEQVQREATDRWRLRKPQVLVDPWGEGVFLDLPPQQVPATAIYSDIAWQVQAGDETHSIPVRIRRTGFDRKTETEAIPLSQPAEGYQVSLLVDNQAKRTWRYQGVSEECPLLVFDPEQGGLLSWTRSLPAKRLGLLYPETLSLRVGGEGQLLEALPRLPWGWASLRGEIWDLARAGRVSLVGDDGEVLSATLRPDESSLRPELVGGQLLSQEVRGARAPVYVGPPPSIRIPLTGRSDPGEELARWRLRVHNMWPAAPILDVTATLAELRPALSPGEKGADLPLGLPSLLGDAPRGSFVVRLRGPLGRDAEFTLRLVPHLVICGHEILYVPDAQSGPQPATLLVETRSGDSLECQAAGGQCRIQACERHEDVWQYEIGASPDVAEVELTVVRSAPSGDAIRVPVSVPIRRLRWALIGDQTGLSRREWTGRIIRRPIEALLQSQSPCLLVALPLAEEDGTSLQLRLVDVDNEELQVADPISPPRGHRPWRFELAGFLDTVRTSRSPVLRVELNAENLPGLDMPLRLPVLSLTQTLIVSDVELRARRVNGRVVFELAWREPTPLRNRHVRFWPLWRPWDPVLEQIVPDEVEGAYAFNVPPNRLGPGKYRIEFLVVDPWAPPEAVRSPPGGAPSTADVELISPERRLQYLDARMEEGGPGFELLLERAFIYRDMGNPQAAQLAWQWCFDHLDDGTIPQILALADLVEATGDQATLTGLKLKMFAPARVEHLLQEHNRVSTEHFQRYLDRLPRSGLLHRATSRQLLSVDDETVRLHAVQQLIRRNDTLGVDAVLRWVEAATLSDADATAILRLSGQFSADYLEGRLDNPTALRLLEALSLELGDRTPVVRPGIWVCTDAGWGRIERIEDLTGRSVQQYIRGQTDYRLFVTLRPSIDAEPIEVDLTRKLISFCEAVCIYTCTKCKGCSACDWSLLVNRHDKVAHGGVGPAYRKERVTFRSLRTLEYSARPPLEAGLGLWNR